jgi:hypothetical protein
MKSNRSFSRSCVLSFALLSSVLMTGALGCSVSPDDEGQAEEKASSSQAQTTCGADKNQYFKLTVQNPTCRNVFRRGQTIPVRAKLDVFTPGRNRLPVLVFLCPTDSRADCRLMTNNSGSYYEGSFYVPATPAYTSWGFSVIARDAGGGEVQVNVEIGLKG